MRIGQFIQIKRVDQVYRGRGAVDKPAVIITFDDLAFFGGEHQIAHHCTHYVLQGHDAHDQRVLIEYHGKVSARTLEHFQNFRQRERVRDKLHLLNKSLLGDGNRFSFKQAPQHVFAVDKADDVINVAVTDQKVVVRVLADLFANFRFHQG